MDDLEKPRKLPLAVLTGAHMSGGSALSDGCTSHVTSGLGSQGSLVTLLRKAIDSVTHCSLHISSVGLAVGGTVLKDLSMSSHRGSTDHGDIEGSRGSHEPISVGTAALQTSTMCLKHTVLSSGDLSRGF